VLKQVPAVATWLRQRETGSGEAHDWPEWKDEWVKARIEDQMGFYHRARERADCQRRRFTRAATLTMDVMLALSVAAVLMTMNPRAGQWIRVLGDYGLEVALGLTGVLLPLGLILVQALRSMLELNRRSGRFTRQVAMLEAAKIDLESTDSENEALEMVRETESQLLAEVVDWYFETEAAESFFSVRERKEKAGASTGGRPSSGRSWLTKWTWIVGGLGFFFLLRVVLGRAPWLLGASGATLCWLAYVTPSDAEMRKELRGNGRLLDTQGEAWAPDALKRDAGCIVIAHGLHDGAILTAAGTESQWMRGMRGALEQRLGSAMPNVAFVDWHLEASPAESLRIAFPTEAGRFAADVVAIRPQGWEVGDYLAFRLAQWIAEGEIRRDRPLHLIGHSAGGFVVSRAALRLLQMNLAPEGMRVTILDTPQPGDEILLELPGQCKVDFYRTSGFVLGLENAAASDQLHLFEPPLEREMNLLEQHSFAHQWFTQTILKANQGDEGFGLSPFCPSRDEVE
jgi:pimeloyl-ACP methyl ester carboxylesterase